MFEVYMNKNGNKVTLILDSSHHAMRLISVCKKEDTAEEGYGLWKYYFLNGIFQYIEKFKADEVIIAVDSRTNWRKQIFPYYKSHRKLLRDKIDKSDDWFNFKEYFKIYSDFLEEIKKNLPFKVIEVSDAEADDIAGILINDKVITKVIVSCKKKI